MRHVTLSYPNGWVAELLLVAVLLAQRDLFDHVRRVRKALDSGGVEAGRESVAEIVGRDTGRMDQFWRSPARRSNRWPRISATGWWLRSSGICCSARAGMAAYKAINTLDSMIGHRTPHYRAFGRAAAKLDDGVN